jgi:hypothetical protein
MEPDEFSYESKDKNSYVFAYCGDESFVINPDQMIKTSRLLQIGKLTFFIRYEINDTEHASYQEAIHTTSANVYHSLETLKFKDGSCVIIHNNNVQSGRHGVFKRELVARIGLQFKGLDKYLNGGKIPKWIEQSEFYSLLWNRESVPALPFETFELPPHVFYHSNTNLDRIDGNLTREQYTYWENITSFYLQIYGIDSNEFQLHPCQYSYILGCALGFHSWICGYTLDKDGNGCDIEQPWPLLYNPISSKRSGDCEDSSKDIQYNFLLLRKARHSKEYPLTECLSLIADNYSCILIESELWVKGRRIYHVYPSLIRKDRLVECTGVTVYGLEINEKCMDVLWVEGTHPCDPSSVTGEHKFDINLLKKYLRANPKARVPLLFDEINKERSMYGAEIKMYSSDLLWDHDIVYMSPTDQRSLIQCIQQPRMYCNPMRCTGEYKKTVQLYDSLLPRCHDLKCSVQADVSNVTKSNIYHLSRKRKSDNDIAIPAMDDVIVYFRK